MMVLLAVFHRACEKAVVGLFSYSLRDKEHWCDGNEVERRAIKGKDIVAWARG